MYDPQSLNNAVWNKNKYITHIMPYCIMMINQVVREPNKNALFKQKYRYKL